MIKWFFTYTNLGRINVLLDSCSILLIVDTTIHFKAISGMDISGIGTLISLLKMLVLVVGVVNGLLSYCTKSYIDFKVSEFFIDSFFSFVQKQKMIIWIIRLGQRLKCRKQSGRKSVQFEIKASPSARDKSVVLGNFSLLCYC